MNNSKGGIINTHSSISIILIKSVSY